MSSSTEQEGEISTPNVQKLSSDLRPLMFWMSNATELLNFFQVKVEVMEKEWEFEGERDFKILQKRWIITEFWQRWTQKLKQTQNHSSHWSFLWSSGGPSFDGRHGHLLRSSRAAGRRHHAHLPTVCVSPHQGTVWICNSCDHVVPPSPLYHAPF